MVASRALEVARVDPFVFPELAAADRASPGAGPRDRGPAARAAVDVHDAVAGAGEEVALHPLARPEELPAQGAAPGIGAAPRRGVLPALAPGPRGRRPEAGAAKEEEYGEGQDQGGDEDCGKHGRSIGPPPPRAKSESVSVEMAPFGGGGH